MTKEPGLFSKGEKVIKCSVCSEVLDTKIIEQTCPLPLVAVIAMGAGMVLVVVSIIIVRRKKSIR